MNAIRDDIAYEVDKNVTPISFESAVEIAKRIERSLLRYGTRSVAANIGSSASSTVTTLRDRYGVTNSNVSDSSVVSSMSSLVDKLERLSINLLNVSNGQAAGVMEKQPVSQSY